MRTLLLVCTLAFSMLTLQAADTPKPHPEMQKFAAFSGKWKLNETLEESPLNPAGKATYDSESALIYNGHFFKESGKGNFNNIPIEYTILTRYDASANSLVSVYYDSSGAYSPAKVTVDRNTIRSDGESEINGKKYKIRSVSKFSDDRKKFEYHWEYSEDGSTWKTAFKGVGVSK